MAVLACWPKRSAGRGGEIGRHVPHQKNRADMAKLVDAQA